MKSICVFCGSSDKIPAYYLDAAADMGAILAQRGVRIIYGAGGTGLMGAVANGALAAGGEVVGVIPEFFNTPHLVHKKLTVLEVVETMHQRKARMAELADGFIALPGGFGTLEELFEIITWAQIGLHKKPIGLLNTRGYYNPLIALTEHARKHGFIYDEHRQLFTYADHPVPLLETMVNHKTPEGLEQWVTRDS
ncbi:MAG TPA: TIGR00730 family Rossman fold protein [Anaerolineales bacterium]|nr:TIGR00730 family Rossman fold protein [Anaerolineales bacterium]